MAFAAGSRARVKLSNADCAVGVVQPQPPLIGVVTDITVSTLYVNMGNGIPTLVEDTAAMDEIGDADSVTRDTLIDKVVTIDGYASTYTGRVVDVYMVNAAIRVLVCSLMNGMFYEVPYANVSVIGDR